MKNICKVTFVIIGTIIGAGFASGQEIYTFFNKYGEYGLIGLTISIALISVIIYKTFKNVMENKIDSYQEFLINIMPQKLKNNKILIFTINNIINIFLLISFNIMVAGFATYFFQELSISKWIGAIIIAMLAFSIFSKSINGVIKINTYLIPTIIVLIVFLGINKINTIEIFEQVDNTSLYWIISSILYTSYNSITLIPILVSLKNQISTKKDARKSISFYIYNNDYIVSNNIYTYEFIFESNTNKRTSNYIYSKYIRNMGKIYLWNCCINCNIYNCDIYRIWFSK